VRRTDEVHKTKFTRPSFVLALCIALISLTGCEKHQGSSSLDGSDRVSTPTSSGACRVPNVPTTVSTALCSADVGQIRTALFTEDLRRNSAEDHAAFIDALRHIWEGDKNFGVQLPWRRLADRANRAVIIDVLAQAYRNHDTDTSLAEMQKFAIELVNSGRDDLDEYEGVRLLGLTDAKEEIPLLRRIAMSNDPSERRYKAIEALGYVCDKEAMQTLGALSVSLRGREPDSTWIGSAIRARKDIQSSWCRELTQ
jgi:hypothetical protein